MRGLVWDLSCILKLWTMIDRNRLKKALQYIGYNLFYFSTGLTFIMAQLYPNVPVEIKIYSFLFFLLAILALRFNIIYILIGVFVFASMIFNIDMFAVYLLIIFGVFIYTLKLSVPFTIINFILRSRFKYYTIIFIAAEVTIGFIYYSIELEKMLLFESIFIFMVLCIIEVIWGKKEEKRNVIG